MKMRFVLITAVAVVACVSFDNRMDLISPVAAADSPPMHMFHSPLTEPGNDAFGTIQEVIRALEADPHTDWTKVNLEALREHLVDMNNMTLRVTVLTQQPIANGVEITVAPESAQVAASLDRVFAAHPPQLEAETGWKMSTQKQQGKYRIVVTTAKPDEVAKIRGLGYIGILATGAHHQAHHWAMARGINPHHH
jgi:hypothetical protein